MLEIHGEPESPKEKACLRYITESTMWEEAKYDEPKTLNEGVRLKIANRRGVFKIYDVPESPNGGGGRN